MSDPVALKHICASCYLQGKKKYMLDAASFGVQKVDDFYPKYVSQGMWTRCLDCQKAVGADVSRSAQAEMTPDRASRKRDSRDLEEATEETTPGGSDKCTRCNERSWNMKLTPGRHGCSVCKNGKSCQFSHTKSRPASLAGSTDSADCKGNNKCKGKVRGKKGKSPSR